MVGRRSVELPEGWIESIKTTNGRKIKIYTNEESGKKLYSKTEVMRHFIGRSITQESPQQSTQQITPQQSAQLSSPQQPFAQQLVQWSSQQSTPQEPSQQERLATDDETNVKIVSTNEIPGWLPSGWRMEVKSCKSGAHIGRGYKLYVDPSTGRKFYSKPEVLQYLKSVEHGDMECNTKKRKRGPRNSSSDGQNEPVDTSPSKQKPGNSISNEMKTADASPAELTEKTDAFLDEPNSTPEWLPSGWKMEIKSKKTGKKFKCFIEPTTRFKFYSKPEVLRFLNGGKTVARLRKKNRKPTEESPIIEVVDDKSAEELISPPSQETTNSKRLSQKHETFVENLGRNFVIERGTPDKLPSGWIKEVKIEKKVNNIRKDPYYTDPVSRYVFRSQNDALRYLETGDINVCAIKPKKRDKMDWLSGDISGHVNQAVDDKSVEEIKSPPSQETTNSKRSPQKQATFVKNLGRNIVIERGTPNKLPSGWIKEIKIEQKANTIRKDPYYTDPVSKYVFRSQTDAMRYLETGDINLCAIRPKKRDEIKWLTGDINSLLAADTQKLRVQDSKDKLFEGKQTSISGHVGAKSNEHSIKRQDKPPEGNLENERPKEDANPTSGKTEAKTELPMVDGKRTRGRKMAYSGTMKKRTNLPCRSSKRLLASRTETVKEKEPVQTEPETNSVKPSLAETLNKALGIEEEDIVKETAVENTINPPIKKTNSKKVENNNQQQQQEMELYQQLGGSSSISMSSPWPEISREPAWLMNHSPLEFSFKTTLDSNSEEQGPVVQDYFQQQSDAANKKAELGAPGFPSFNLFQENAAATYNFLQTSSVSPSISSQSPANPLFHSEIMPPAHQTMFAPDSNTQNHQSPANPMFPHGGFGFGFH